MKTLQVIIVGTTLLTSLTHAFLSTASTGKGLNSNSRGDLHKAWSSPPPQGVEVSLPETTTLSTTTTFPIPPQDLISKAQDIVLNKQLGLKDDGACLADNFTFRAAIIEIVSKKHEFLNALRSFRLDESFDITPTYFGWHVDPTQPNRVWFMGRSRAIQKGDFFGAAATGKELILPPECLHVDFNEQGKVIEFGFYTADRAQGNTGGLGGAFGYFYGVGKPLPFPECRPYQKSWQFRLFESLSLFAKQVRQQL